MNKELIFQAIDSFAYTACVISAIVFIAKGDAAGAALWYIASMMKYREMT